MVSNGTDLYPKMTVLVLWIRMHGFAVLTNNRLRFLSLEQFATGSI